MTKLWKTIISVRPHLLVLNDEVHIMKYNRIAKNDDLVLGGKKEESGWWGQFAHWDENICLIPKFHLSVILVKMIWDKVLKSIPQ